MSINLLTSSNFRRDSDVVAPYEKWEYFDPRVHQIEQDRNYALNKTKKVINSKLNRFAMMFIKHYVLFHIEGCMVCLQLLSTQQSTTICS